MSYRIDYERAYMLLMIVEKVANVAPTYTALSGEAMRELRELNDSVAQEAAERITAEQKDKGILPGQPTEVPTAPMRESTTDQKNLAPATAEVTTEVPEPKSGVASEPEVEPHSEPIEEQHPNG